MKELEFSNHALDRLQQYGISRVDVRHALENPYLEQVGRHGARVIVGPAVGGEPIRVVVSEESRQGVIFVITVHWFARGKKWST